jgi:hypothetical protein
MVLACMQPGSAYQVFWNGKPVPVFERYPGLLEITLGGEASSGLLEVIPSPAGTSLFV